MCRVLKVHKTVMEGEVFTQTTLFCRNGIANFNIELNKSIRQGLAYYKLVLLSVLELANYFLLP